MVTTFDLVRLLRGKLKKVSGKLSNFTYIYFCHIVFKKIANEEKLDNSKNDENCTLIHDHVN